MNVHVSENAERIIRSHVQSGKYSSDSEVIEAALLLLDQRTASLAPRKPLTEEEFKQQLIQAGLMSGLPVPLPSAARTDFQPIALEGEPLSETIIRERR
jgi:putative addiction module CopG family antidote